MTKVSFITFTKNSSKLIDGLLGNVKDIVDEIIVIDGGSTDDTIEKAKSYGAKVYVRRSWGYAEPDRMFALKKASYDWILYLDDDERLNRKLKNAFKDIVEMYDRKGISALSIVRINITSQGKPILGALYPDRQIRIYSKYRIVYKGLVHELPKVQGLIEALPDDYAILHFSVKHVFTKMIMYAYLEKLQYYRHETKNVIKRALWTLAPASALMIYLYYITLSLVRRKPLNVPSFTPILYRSLYETLVHTLTKLRDEREKKIAKLVQSKGLIQLLGLDKDK